MTVTMSTAMEAPSKILLNFLIVLFSTTGFSQCVSGDCKDGFGKFDYGFAVYEGNFVSEKPNGQGTMDYGGGDKFVGNFKNGQEDGDGRLFKNNVPLDVTYVNGKVKIRTAQNIIGANAPAVKGCIQGDCYNGFGIVNYDSGNRFEGIFKYGLIGDQGKFIYKNGDYFEGKFENELNTEGKYFFAKENVTYNGTFYADGREKSGNFYYPTNRATVTVTDGKVTKVDNPVAREIDSLNAEAKKGKMCSKCGGTGMCGGGSYLQTTEDYYSINYVNRSGNTVGTSSGNIMKSTSRVSIPKTICSVCNGKGKVFNQGTIINTNRY